MQRQETPFIFLITVLVVNRLLSRNSYSTFSSSCSLLRSIMLRNMQLNLAEGEMIPLPPSAVRRPQSMRASSPVPPSSGKIFRQCHSWSESPSSNSVRSSPSSTRYSSPSDSRVEISPKDTLIRSYKSREINEKDFFKALTPREDH